MTLSVLLVEDSGVLRRSLRDLLHRLGGFRVVAELAAEAPALQWLRAHARGWDLAVVDLVLEQGTGMAVIAACKAQPVAGRVVVFSDYVTDEVRDYCLRLGADAVFQKGRDGTALADYCGALPRQA
ncbi:response regulator [Ramlibacter tataouinensis]|uniref:response regulator n=1 Tax=Ramlibacter tataouinensis TaxID=94132 RepID=UPI0005A17BE0|nr:response regulator [Ramlibacter tataouinensis]